MKLTKFGHSCVRLDEDGRVLLLDPGVLTDFDLALDGVDDVLITHEHADHVDVPKLLRAVEANPRLRVWAPASMGEALASLGERFTPTRPGQNFPVAGFDVQTVGGQHALIHSSIPVISNVGYVIDSNLYHPGDSFFVPNVTVQTLLVPIHAPWSKVGEVLDFVIAVRPAQAFQIHDGLLNGIGIGFVEQHLNRIGGEYSVDYTHLDVAQHLTV